MHGLPFAQFQQSAPRAGRHEMEIRDADGPWRAQAGPGQHLAVRGRVTPPARAVFPRLVLPPQARGPGGSSERGSGSRRRFRYTLANFVSRHSPGQPARSRSVDAHAGRDNGGRRLTHSSPPTPGGPPLEARRTAAGVGTFTWPKTGTANWPLTSRWSNVASNGIRSDEPVTSRPGRGGTSELRYS